MMNVLLYGSGSLAREIFDFEAASKNGGVKFIGYVNDFESDLEFELHTGLSRIHFDNVFDDVSVLICVADPLLRQSIMSKIINNSLRLFTYIHPTALISKSSIISEGCIIYPFVTVSSRAELGACVILNSYTGVGHDVVVGHCSTISAQVDLTGGVVIGKCCFLGSGSRVAPKKKIGDYSKIGIGVSVIRSLKECSNIFPLPNKVS